VNKIGEQYLRDEGEASANTRGRRDREQKERSTEDKMCLF
jgi:hypothetical protein